jgi:hypothetical protein
MAAPIEPPVPVLHPNRAEVFRQKAKAAPDPVQWIG